MQYQCQGGQSWLFFFYILIRFPSDSGLLYGSWYNETTG